MKPKILLVAVLILVQGVLCSEEISANPSPLAHYRYVPWQYLQTIVGYGPRNPSSIGYQRTREYILEMGKKFADEVVEQSFIHRLIKGEELSLSNIELRFGIGGPPVLIGAHYDTRPFADEEPNPSLRTLPILGANDGGSGTAVLLALARYLHENPPKQSVRLVFFDGEDYGVKGSSEYLLGSTHYAGHLKKQDRDEWPLCVLVIDMIGDKDLQIYKENHSLKNAPWLVNLIDRVAREKNGFRQFMEKSRYTMLDDHYPFIQRGIPSAVLIDFDYPYWHTRSDTLDKCSPESLYVVFVVLIGVLEELQAVN